MKRCPCPLSALATIPGCKGWRRCADCGRVLSPLLMVIRTNRTTPGVEIFWRSPPRDVGGPFDYPVLSRYPLS